MGHRIGDYDGTLYLAEGKEHGAYAHKVLVRGVTCTNGMDWVDDGRTM